MTTLIKAKRIKTEQYDFMTYVALDDNGKRRGKLKPTKACAELPQEEGIYELEFGKNDIWLDTEDKKYGKAYWIKGFTAVNDYDKNIDDLMSSDTDVMPF